MFLKNARKAVPDNLISPLETCASVLVWFVTSIVQITHLATGRHLRSPTVAKQPYQCDTVGIVLVTLESTFDWGGTGDEIEYQTPSRPRGHKNMADSWSHDYGKIHGTSITDISMYDIVLLLLTCKRISLQALHIQKEAATSK